MSYNKQDISTFTRMQEVRYFFLHIYIYIYISVFKNDINLNCAQKLNSYLKKNRLHIRREDQFIYSVKERNYCYRLMWNAYTGYTYEQNDTFSESYILWHKYLELSFI